VRVALATCAPLADGWPDDHLLAEALRRRGSEALFGVWDDPSFDWGTFDRVVVRSTWDYTGRRDLFLRWALSLDGRLENPAAVLEWNSDKHYLAELRDAGIHVVETAYVGPGDPDPPLPGEVVVKPAVSAGARDTGRFSADAHAGARALLDRLRGAGRVAMVQPYLGSVDERGETAIVYFGGAESHVLRKQAVLSPDEEAPLRDDQIGSAEAMYRDDLVGAGEAGAAERSLAGAVIDHLRERFGRVPLYARVDMVAGDDGRPLLLELELVEPLLYLASAPGSAERLAEALLARAGGRA
jgi:hypothetical protein